MGYRLQILGIKTDTDIIKTHSFYGTKFYGTKFYGYLRGEESELYSFQYLIKINKLNIDEYFGYGSDNRIFLTRDEFITFILLYDFDLKHDKEVKHEYNLLEDKDIKELLEFDYNIYDISWG